MEKAAERIEDVRVAWERDLEREFAGRPYTVIPDRDPGRHEPRVLLERAMAERVHRVADLAAERLGCTDPFVLYQTPRADRHLSAQAMLPETPFAIRLIGPVARGLDDGGLTALVGHELGHWLALGPRASPKSLVLDAAGHGASPRVVRMGTIAAELTADRFSLVAAGGELEAAVRLEVCSMTLDSPQALGVRELEYLKELCRRVEAREVPAFRQDGWNGYPSSAFRMFATWLFWRSDVHRELTGAGPADIALRDADATLRMLCEEDLARESEQKAGKPAGPVARVRPSGGPCAARSEPANRAGPSFLDEAHAAVRAAGQVVAGVVGRLQGEAPRPVEGRPSSEDDEDEIDDLEAQFRALERRAGTQPSPAAAAVPEDLEARFRALEERERSGDFDG